MGVSKNLDMVEMDIIPIDYGMYYSYIANNVKLLGLPLEMPNLAHMYGNLRQNIVVKPQDGLGGCLFAPNHVEILECKKLLANRYTQITIHRHMSIYWTVIDMVFRCFQYIYIL